MKSLLLLCLITFSLVNLQAQDLNGSQLLEKAIQYHDPNGNWDNFSSTFNLILRRADGTEGSSEVKIDLPNEYFSTTIIRDQSPVQYTIDKGACKTSISEPKKDAKRTPCETATLYKNYYTYLYGLPMKLKDPGTHIADQVERKTFKGKEYLVLKASYDKEVGSDVWFFYFDPGTYAMEVYQFYKGEPSAEGKDTGEYILLSEEKVIKGIKMPKTRAWYYNKDDKYLGTDILK